MFLYDGQPVPSGDGLTVAAALVRAGMRPRLFCGIGVCFDCVVKVNGERWERACLFVAAQGDRIESCTTSS